MLQAYFLASIMLQTYFNMLEDFTSSIFFKASKHVTYMFKASKHICTLPNLVVIEHQTLQKKGAPKVRLELTTYRLTAGRAADCAIQELA